jgi:hypothetical protein
VFLAPPRILATSDGRALRECLPDTRLAPNVPPGVVGTRGLGRTNSGGSRPDRIPRPAAQPETGPRGRSAAAGPGGGTTLGWGASVAPPPVFPPEPAATTASGEHRERALDAGRCARLPALIATLSGPDREIVLLRVVAGVSIPDIVAALGVTPAASRLAEHQALGALQPAASANAPRADRVDLGAEHHDDRLQIQPGQQPEHEREHLIDLRRAGKFPTAEQCAHRLQHLHSDCGGDRSGQQISHSTSRTLSTQNLMTNTATLTATATAGAAIRAPMPRP